MPGFDLVRPLPHRPAPSFNSLGKANSTRLDVNAGVPAGLMQISAAPEGEHPVSLPRDSTVHPPQVERVSPSRWRLS